MKARMVTAKEIDERLPPGSVHQGLALLTEPLEPTVRPFHDRPFQVIDAGRFCSALWRQITDEAVRQIPVAIGSIDQFSDNTDLREHVELHHHLQSLY